MEMLEQFMKNNNLQDSSDIDSLLEVASLIRELIRDKQYTEINDILNYIVENSYYEAFSWCMEILQEEFEKGHECGLKDFVCNLGRSIPDYNEFTQRLEVNFDVLKNDVEKKLDEHGEVQSFFNIFTYKTRYQNIYLITAENFDVKDNDFIQYQLSFTRN